MHQPHSVREPDLHQQSLLGCLKSGLPVRENKKILEDGGMTIINYDDSFFDEILALDGVRTLYDQIDQNTNGLAQILQDELTQ